MAHGGPVKRAGDGIVVAIQVTPKARRQRIEGVAVDADGRSAIKVAVTAPPADGKANEAVIALLARAWRVPKSRITIRSGAGGRRKLLAVAGDATALQRYIENSVKETTDG